jgi:2-methylfumaryl-CoA hydratase
VLRYHRWVMVHKRDPQVVAPPPHEPVLPAEVAVADLPVPPALKLQRFADLEWATGGRAWFEDYQVGERIHHIDGMTIDDVDHTSATRMYQNTAKVHFNHHQMQESRFGKRLIYGGHVISVAHALAVNGLENLVWMAAWNSGTHANPTFAGDTLYAFTDVLAAEPLPGRTDLGALRLRLVALKNVDPSQHEVQVQVTAASGKSEYDPRVVLDLDWWGLVPRRGS